MAPDTAERVFSAARELGFVPSRVARQLARGTSGIVALVVPTLDNSFFTPIIAGAQARAGEADLQLTVAVHPLEDIAELGAFERLSRQVDGFILVAPRGGDDVVHGAGAFKPTVLVDRELAGLTSVVADTATAFGSLIDRFIVDGHSRLAYIGGPEGSWQDRQRTAAVRNAAAGRAELLVLGPLPSTFAAGVGVAAEIVDGRATAVLPYATAIGLGLMFALRSTAHRDVGVTVSSERMIVESLGLADVPAIDVDGEELGRVAMDRLLDALAPAGAPPSADRLTVPVRWPNAR